MAQTPPRKGPTVTPAEDVSAPATPWASKTFAFGIAVGSLTTGAAIAVIWLSVTSTRNAAAIAAVAAVISCAVAVVGTIFNKSRS